MRVLAAVGEHGGTLTGLERMPGVSVAGRYDDLDDLLVTAATGAADAALLSADLPRLDREVVARLAASGVAVVAVTATDDEPAERRLRQLGIAHVRPADVSSGALWLDLHDAVARLAGARPGRGFANPVAVVPERGGAAPADPGAGPRGRVVAVWGPTGAPGRTTVATGLAGEIALRGWPTLLVDADVYGGAVATRLGLLTESPGFVAACRLANTGQLDAPALAGLGVEVSAALRVLTGLDGPARWPELRPASVEAVLDTARSLAAVTVVDCGFCLEQDEELSYDTLAPRRNGATLAALEAADLVVVVGSNDAAGLRRLGDALDDLAVALPEVRRVVVLNRVRAGAARPWTGDVVGLLPLDVDAAGAAEERPLASAAPSSPLRDALQSLASTLVSTQAPAAGRRVLGRSG